MNWIVCLGFLKRSIEVVDGVTHIKVNPKYIDGLVSLLENIRRRRTPCDLIINNLPLESEDEVKLYRSCVGTLLYVSQYLIKELAAKLQSPTQGAMATMRNLVGYMHAINQFLGSSSWFGYRARVHRWEGDLALGGGNRFRLEWTEKNEIIYHLRHGLSWWYVVVWLLEDAKAHHAEQHRG